MRVSITKTVLAGLVAGLLIGVAAPAFARADEPSESAMVNLIRLLVKQGTLTREAGDALLAQAKAEANQARAARRERTAHNRPETPPPAEPAAAPAPPLPNAAVAAAPPPPEGTIRVPYVPEVVRNQIRDEVKAEVLAEAQRDNWAQPEALPGWIRSIDWSGDIRVRDQSSFYGSGNVGPLFDTDGNLLFGSGFIDYNAWNANGPIDVAAAFPPVPLLNTLEDRTNVFNFRARLALHAQINEFVSATIRLATGSNNGPVSTTQVLGGGWDKKDFWLDQAYVTITPAKWATLNIGRMPNPFLHTDLVYDDDLNFDGAAVSLDPRLGRHMNIFATAGAFPVEYLGSDTPQTSSFKAPSFTKWMWGAQAGIDWQVGHDSSWKLAAAYYDFQHVQGELSKPCVLDAGNTFCSSDPTRPAFLQKGNTLFFIRDIVPGPDQPINPPLPEYVGLLFDYNLLNINTELNLAVSDSYHLLLQGDYVRNLAFDKNDDPPGGSRGHNINNCGSAPIGDLSCPLAAGDTGWMAKMTFGYLAPSEPWEWNIVGGYKYLRSDAVLDAFTDSDFHLGGTNAKGYFIGGSVAVYRNTWLTGRWLSADEISGTEPLAIDVLQIDLNTRF